MKTDELPKVNLNLQFKLTPLFSSLISSYKDSKFLPNGGRLAFGLDHKYGVVGKYNKGKDAVLVQTSRRWGFHTNSRLSIGWIRTTDAPTRQVCNSFFGRSSDFSLGWLYRVHSQLPLSCNEADEARGTWMEYELSVASQLIQEGAKADHTLVWVKRPAKYWTVCTYAGVGNERLWTLPTLLLQ